MNTIRNASRLMIPGGALVLLAACGGGSGDSAEAASAPANRVEIVEPANGSTVLGPDVRVVLTAHGVRVEPADNRQTSGRGHHHIFLNEDLSPVGQPIPPTAGGIVHLGSGAEEYLIEGIEPGDHRLIAWFAYGDHVPINEVGADTVFFTVVEP